MTQLLAVTEVRFAGLGILLLVFLAGLLLWVLAKNGRAGVLLALAFLGVPMLLYLSYASRSVSSEQAFTVPIPLESSLVGGGDRWDGPFEKFYVADRYSSAEAAAASLARQCARRLTQQGTDAYEQVHLVDGSGTVEPAVGAAFLQTLVESGVEVGEVAAPESCPLTLSAQREAAGQRRALHLQVPGLEDPLVAAFAVDKDWVRDPESYRATAPGEYFVARGQSDGAKRGMFRAQTYAAARLSPAVAAQLPQVTPNYRRFQQPHELQELSAMVVDRLTVDRFEQRFHMSMDGRSGVPGLRRTALLVDQREAALQSAVQQAYRELVDSGRQRRAEPAVYIGLVALLLTIFGILWGASRWFDQRRVSVHRSGERDEQDAATSGAVDPPESAAEWAGELSASHQG